MNPESLLENLAKTDSTSIYKTMLDADASFRALIRYQVPIQYGLHTGGARPIIIDSDDVHDIETAATPSTLNKTLDDYQARLRKHQSAFTQFAVDNFQRTSNAMQSMMQIEVGWAFFYWCSLSRLYEEHRIPTTFSVRAGQQYFRGFHV